jgi:hypothetical protein
MLKSFVAAFLSVGKKIDSEFSQSKKLDKTLKMKRLFIQLSLTNSESIFFLSLILSLAWMQPARAQRGIAPDDLATIQAVEDTLGLLAYAFVNDSLEENRFLAVRAFIPTLVKALKHPNSFEYPFTQLHTVSVQYPADSTFRIFTWQLYVDENTYRYYGAIQMNTPELQLFPLVDRSFEFDGDLEQATLAADNWYGALYYNIYPVVQGDQTYYLLFGFDAFSFFRKRKLVDVLTFRDGKPQFGLPVFRATAADGTTSTQNRLYLEYSAAASVHCNYDPAFGMILYDHLETVAGQHGEGPVNIPDGTYEGYQLQNGIWEYNEKVFHEMLDEAPRPAPVLQGRKVDMMGRTKNERGR